MHVWCALSIVLITLAYRGLRGLRTWWVHESRILFTMEPTYTHGVESKVGTWLQNEAPPDTTDNQATIGYRPRLNRIPATGPDQWAKSYSFIKEKTKPSFSTQHSHLSKTNTLGKFPHKTWQKKWRFTGLDIDSQGQPAEIESSIYRKDESGEEMSELARVWRVYVNEATKFDSSLIEGCNRGIDMLLVFVSTFYKLC